MGSLVWSYIQRYTTSWAGLQKPLRVPPKDHAPTAAMPKGTSLTAALCHSPFVAHASQQRAKTVMQQDFLKLKSEHTTQQGPQLTSSVLQTGWVLPAWCQLPGSNPSIRPPSALCWGQAALHHKTHTTFLPASYWPGIHPRFAKPSAVTTSLV